MTIDLGSLIGKLNTTTVLATESAAALAVSHSHREVDVEHLILELLRANQSDVFFICKHFGIDPSALSVKLSNVILSYKKNSSKTPVLSLSLIRLIELSWLVSSVEFSSKKIRSGHLFIALLQDAQLFNAFSQGIDELVNIETRKLLNQFNEITINSVEGMKADKIETAGSEMPHESHEIPLKHLLTYSIDMTGLASHGSIDPVIGREQEVRQVVDVLSRRRQNNPILVGEAGVGKTAVVEGLALKINAGDVPAHLKDARLFSLDLALLQAGASMKGEFESRLKAVIEEIEQSRVPILLFIDETHGLVGAGGQSGQNDAANILKPALARGALRTIGATTWSEYKKYIEKDSALSRRFQLIKVAEPTESQAITMLRAVAKTIETHHGVRILDEAVMAAVKLSSRYITGRLLPDKAISVLDTAAARSSISMESLPSAIEDLRTQQLDYDTELKRLRSEYDQEVTHEARISIIQKELTDLKNLLFSYEEQWEKEKKLIAKLDALEPFSSSNEAAQDMTLDISSNNEKYRSQYQATMSELLKIQGESPMILPLVNSRLISEVISDWTGIPTGKMMSNQIYALQKLEQTLAARVIGQEHALKTISQRVKTSRSGIEDPGKPVGVFLLVGTSGVGKTETAIALADIFYGGDRSLITINMSEYQEAHSVSLLRGSPPGYVGYGTGGVLTEAVKRQPYSVLLLDEVEKAHPDVLEVFYQIFDKGVMDDGEGQEVDFKNTIIFLTSNACSELIAKVFEERPDIDIEEINETLRPNLQKYFQPAFLGRLQIIPFKPISPSVLKKISKSKLSVIEQRLLSTYSITLKYRSEVIEGLVRMSMSTDIGARALNQAIDNFITPVISELILESMASKKIISEVNILPQLTSDGNFKFEVKYKNLNVALTDL